MADVKYVVMSSEVVIDSSNDAIVITAGASTETLSIAHGSWYITGAAANNLAYKVAAAIQTHSNITTCTVSGTSFEINDSNQPTCSIAFTADAAFQIVVGAAETFDWQLLGFSVTTSTGATPSGDCEILGLWVSDQAPENEIKGPFTAEISQESALDGSVYTFKRGSIEQAHGFAFNFRPWRQMAEVSRFTRHQLTLLPLGQMAGFSAHKSSQMARLGCAALTGYLMRQHAQALRQIGFQQGLSYILLV